MSDQTENPSTTENPAGSPDGPAPADVPDQGAKAALQAERKARKEAERLAREADARAGEAAERLAALERQELVRAVAADKSLTEAQAAFLTGSTREELAASADALTAAFASSQPDRRPTENLRPGAVPRTSDEGSDVAAVAERVMRL